jgi:hypothetical protein
MPNNLWTAPAGPLQAGTAVAKNTFTTLAAINPPGETISSAYQIYGGTLQPGTQITLEAWGVASNTGTPTIKLGVYYGAAGAVDLALSTAKTTTTAMTNWEWHLWYIGRVTAVGTSGSIIGSGYWRLPTSLTAWTEYRLPETAPAAVTIDTTINKFIGVEAEWSASSSSNTITQHGCIIRIDG